MPVINSIAAFADDLAAWRQHLHRWPELGFDCHDTAGFVAARLREFGVDEIHEGIATSGLVAIIAGQGPGPTIGLRADMDALPISEGTGLAHASEIPGRMHACGHDGHTAMLLGAARYLAQTRRFAGRVALIFQPAEEAGGGAEVMCRDGVLDRFGVERVFAMHNAPNMPEGAVVTAPGPIMAAVDSFEITVTGQGGHAALPQEAVDPVVAAVQIAQAIQTIPARNVSAHDALVISITQIHTGSADNVIPATAWINGTVRTLERGVQDIVRRRMAEICAGTGAAFGCEVALDYAPGYPATVNDAAEAGVLADAAREVVGPGAVTDDAGPEMGAEDFAFMLQARPGAYMFLGQGPGAALHHPEYDFNDSVAPLGASIFARLVERSQPPAEAAAG